MPTTPAFRSRNRTWDAHTFWREVGNDAGVHEPIEGFNVVWIPLGINPSVGTLFEIEHRSPDVWFFVDAGFSFAVKIPDRFDQCFGNIRPFLLKRVPNVV
jgi:hypothetical protein